MKLTKKLESEILKVYNACWNAYLAGDLKTHASFLSPGFKIIGTSESEQFDSKKAWIAYCKKTINQFAGVIKLKKRQIELVPAGEEVMVVENSHIYVLIEGKWTFYSNIRISALLQNTKTGWKYIYQHGSLPDARANEGEVIATEQIKAENLQLRDAVKRRTIELEQKNTDLEIESSLERVRSIAMGMRKPDDLLTVCEILFSELQALGFVELRNTMINIFDDEKGSFLNYDYSAHAGKTIANLFYNTHPVIEKQIQQARSANDAFSEAIFAGKDLDDWKAFRKKGGEADDPRVNDINALYYYFYSIGTGVIGISSYNAVTEEKRDVLKRFRNVFDLAYRRFMDIQQAEAQAREAKVEAAMERTRTQSMIMQHSNELDDTLRVFHEQVLLLGIKSAFSFLWLPDEEKNRHIFWAAWAENGSSVFKSKAIDYPLDRNEPATAQCLLDWKADGQVVSYHVPPAGVENYFAAWQELIAGVEQLKPEYFGGGLYYAEAFMKYGCFGVMIESELSPEEKKILSRFAIEFERTYTRFLDLQKAEAQAREAKIEAALERVRSRTMGMQQSHELGDVANVLFKELNHLVENLWTCGFVLCEKDRGEDEWWLSTGDGFIPAFYLPNTGDPTHANIYDAWKNGETYHTEQLEGEGLQQHYDWLMNIPVSKNIFDDMKAAGNILPAWQKLHCAYFSYGYLVMITQVPCPEEQVFKRFAQVFDQTYTRFLDLKKAEAQAREAEIELALERVRNRAMAMHSSQELKDVATELRNQMSALGQTDMEICAIHLYDESPDYFESIAAGPVFDPMLKSILVQVQVKLPKQGIQIIEEMMNQYYSGKKDYVLINQGKKGVEWFELLKEKVPLAYEFVIQNLSGTSLQDLIYYWSVSDFKGGALVMTTYVPPADEARKILSRLANVFGLAYQRFKDLKKAEAQAREAQIEAALERVRSRTMAMQRSEELADAATVLFQQVKALGVPQWTCGFSIFEIDDKEFTWYPGGPGGEILPPSKIPLMEHPVFVQFNESRKRGDELFIYEKTGEIQSDHYRYMLSLPVVGKYLQSRLDAGEEFPSFQIDHLANFSHGNLIFITYEHFPEMHDIFKRFAKVFEQTYTRFLDLQKAEEQAREAKIEAALERVRSRSMAMHKSEELADLSLELVKQVQALGVATWFCAFNIYDDDPQGSLEWGSNGQGTFPRYRTPREGVFLRYYEAGQKGETLLINEIGENECAAHYEYLCSLPGVGEQLLKMKAAGIPFPTFQIDHAAFFRYGYILFITYEEVPESHDIFKRFAKVFEQTYTRFLDLQKAEAQAREAQIEAALERVRSRTMAMHKSEELKEVIQVVYDQFVHLDIHIEHTGFIIDYKEREDMHIWLADPFASPFEIAIPYFDSPHWNSFIEARQKESDFFSNQLSFEEKNKFYQDLFKLIPALPEESQKAIFSKPGLAISTVLLESIGLYIENFSGIPYTDEENNILMRFGKVFQQTYTRFVDLQKAEAQAWEAQIEASLERVRAKTMAMHNSADVGATVATMFDELVHLGVETNRCGVLVIDETKHMEVWTAKSNPGGQVNMIIGRLNMMIHPLLQGAYNAWKTKQATFEYHMAGDDLKEYYKVINSSPDYPVRFDLESLPPKQVHADFFFPEGALFAFTNEPLSKEAAQIFKRFAGVFGQTYRRFLDLQKAEAQAREAQIEAALERVRTSAMAMQKSNDLFAVAEVLWDQLKKLGQPELESSIVHLYNNDQPTFDAWYAYCPPNYPARDMIKGLAKTSKSSTAWAREAIANYQSPETTYTISASGEKLSEWYKEVEKVAPAVIDYDENGQIIVPEILYYHFSKFSGGALLMISIQQPSPEACDLHKRAAVVFDLAYTRFQDLKNAEAQAKEAIKQAALDRIRADIASMRTVADLDKITPLIWNELNILGIPFIRCGVFIMDDSQELIHTFLSTPNGKAIAAFHLPYDTPGNLSKVLSHWRDHQNYIDHWDESAFADLADTLVKQGAIGSPGQYLSTIPRGGFYLHFLPFLQGMLYVGNMEQLKEEDIQLIQSVADAFSTAYARYEDFNKLEAAKQQVDKTLVELKQAQTQLVQSEKMASLGELTAGIAHEIQNPLNFVNNFSEVSNELLDEMIAELANGNDEDAIAIAEDVKQNLEKILHHGKRADGIVKGMLQHSRSSTAVKEPTDINKLADEYLRLAYHGLRAKDKSFNATLNTHFDESIGNINVIPQDIGRAVLNLITNAFYVVGEKRKQAGDGYEPTVTVSTKNAGDTIEIRVADNGNGIPQKILDKIFQPFFTTKPTGQGTGLGLSLSYDIVRAHGGEIKVETKENEGTAFIIRLPLKD